MIVHRDKVHRGMHPAIVDPDLFEAVQKLLGANRRRLASRRDKVARAPLTGRIFDADGKPMSPTFSYGKRGGRYRYYVSAPLQQGRRRVKGDEAIRRVSAPLLENQLVLLLQRVAPDAAADPLGLVSRVEVHARSVQVLMPHDRFEGVRARLRDGEELLPDAWTDGKASVHSIEQAVAGQRGVVSLPWKLVEAAITGAVNYGFIRVLPGGVAWPCQPHEAAAVEIALPEAPKAKGETKAKEYAEDQAPGPKQKVAFREAVLDSSQLNELVEGMGDVLAAAGNLTLRFRLAVEFAEGEVATPEVAAKLAAALDKLGVGVT